MLNQAWSFKLEEESDGTSATSKEAIRINCLAIRFQFGFVKKKRTIVWVVIFLEVYNLQSSQSFSFFFGALYHSSFIIIPIYGLATSSLFNALSFIHQVSGPCIPMGVYNFSYYSLFMFKVQLLFYFFFYSLCIKSLSSHILMESHPHLKSFLDTWNSFPLTIEMFFFFQFVSYHYFKQAIPKLLTSNIRFFFSRKNH